EGDSVSDHDSTSNDLAVRLRRRMIVKQEPAHITARAVGRAYCVVPTCRSIASATQPMASTAMRCGLAIGPTNSCGAPVEAPKTRTYAVRIESKAADQPSSTLPAVPFVAYPAAM